MVAFVEGEAARIAELEKQAAYAVKHKDQKARDDTKSKRSKDFGACR